MQVGVPFEGGLEDGGGTCRLLSLGGVRRLRDGHEHPLRELDEPAGVAPPLSYQATTFSWVPPFTSVSPESKTEL